MYHYLFNSSALLALKLLTPREAANRELHHLGSEGDKGRRGNNMNQMAPHANKKAKPLLGISLFPKDIKLQEKKKDSGDQCS